MESTADLNEAAAKVRSRRVLLAGAVGGLAAWLASAAQRVMPADASVGDPVLAGKRNSGGGFTTEIRANTEMPVFRAVQFGRGNGLRAQATTGRGLVGIATKGTGVLGESEGGVGVSGRSAGVGVMGFSADGRGVMGHSPAGAGVMGQTDMGMAVYGYATGPRSTGLSGQSSGAARSMALRTSGPSEMSGRVTLFRELELREMGQGQVPTNPQNVNRMLIFARDNGSGKTQLCVLFHTGEIQVLATQP